jgi:hypothetical protein
MPGDIHVIPRRDDVMHTIDVECACGPAVERVETNHGDGWMHIHHSLDGRERREPSATELTL